MKLSEVAFLLSAWSLAIHARARFNRWRWGPRTRANHE